MYVYLWLKNWLEQEEGQDLIEYAMILGLVVLVALALLGVVGGNISTIWSKVSAGVASAASTVP
jgi:pilus assembly protein Flp/PilA